MPEEDDELTSKDELDTSDNELDNPSDEEIENSEPTTDDSSDNSENGSFEASSPPPSTSLGHKILSFWKMLPPPLRHAILVTSGYLIVILLVIVVLMMVMVTVTSVSEYLYEAAHGVGEGIGESLDSFFESAGNFFTGNGFVTDEEAAEIQEKKYYEKLNAVHEEFVNRYGVDIDTTLITATLFYGKGMSDYVDDQQINDFEDTVMTGDDQIFEDEANFYKVARRQIKTLAKFQVIENTTYNACDTTARNKITPESDKDVADTWAGFFGFNTRATFNYQTKQSIPYPRINGETRSIPWCEYDEADEQLREYYKQDQAIYETYQDYYDHCVTSCLAHSCSPYDTNCTPCDPESACRRERIEMNKYHDLLVDSWGTVYDIPDRPTGEEEFQCVYDPTWKNLQRFDDRTKYYNRTFPKEWIDQATEPSFWSEAIKVITGERTDFFVSKDIKCSAKPSIQYYYTTSLEREGVYYYKLLSRTATIGNILQNKSFIERYYEPEFEGVNQEESMKVATQIVEDIYDIYEYVIENRIYCDYSTVALDYGGANYASEDRSSFLQMIASDIVADMQRTGMLASVTMAQAAVESGNGTSLLAREYHNYYGMTAGTCANGASKIRNYLIPPGSNGNNCSGNDYWNGTITYMCNKSGNDCQYYRVYDNFAMSTADHSRLITERYQCRGNSPSQLVDCLQAHNYATATTYRSSVLGVIDTYDLQQFDIGAVNPESTLSSSYENTSSVDSTEESGTTAALNCIPTIGASTILVGEGTISGTGAQGVRTSLLQDSPEYTTFWESDNNLFYRSSRSLINECTWYAHGRGLEILTQNGMSMEQAQRYMEPMAHDAGTWFAYNDYFTSSTDVNQPRVGAIIVWSRAGHPGHVAVIEGIEYDSSRKPVSIAISEGGKSVNGFRYSTRDLKYIEAHGDYRFVGYIYLLG